MVNDGQMADAIGEFLTPGQIEAAHAPKGYRKRATVAMELVELLARVGAASGTIRGGIDSVNGMSKSELKELQGHIQGLRRSLGFEGLDVSGVTVVRHEAETDTTGWAELETEIPMATEVTATPSEESQPAPKRTGTRVVKSRKVEEVVQSEPAVEELDDGIVKTSQKMRTFIEAVTGESAPDRYDSAYASELFKRVKASGHLPAPRRTSTGIPIDGLRRLREFIETNGDVNGIANNDKVTPKSVDLWFGGIRNKFVQERGKASVPESGGGIALATAEEVAEPVSAPDIRDVEEVAVTEPANEALPEEPAATQKVIQPETVPPTESNIEKEPMHVQIAEAWGETLGLESGEAAALKSLLDPNARNADITTPKVIVAEKIWNFVVGKFGSFEAPQLHLAGLESHIAAKLIPPDGGRPESVAMLVGRLKSVRKEDVITACHTVAQRPLDVYHRMQEAQANRPVKKVALVDGKPVLIPR